MHERRKILASAGGAVLMSLAFFLSVSQATGAAQMQQPARSASLAESATLHLEYRDGMKRVAPDFKKNYGRYLGSGSGSIEGAVNGSVAWDLFEEQSDPNLHRTQFVGRITAADGATVSFETTGYFIPRPRDDHYWDLSSAVYFTHAKGADYQRLAGRIGLWRGYVDIRTDDEAGSTYSHTYSLYLPATPASSGNE